VTPSKQARLVALAAAYQDEVQWSGPVRIDVVAVVMAPGGKLERISHLRNAVSA
jgi:Holliday junction resolvase-like predicted endonuclease